MGKKRTDKIIVTEEGNILGVSRYTEIPFEALELASANLMVSGERREFECNRSDDGCEDG